jgi:hypothetical protein
LQGNSRCNDRAGNVVAAYREAILKSTLHGLMVLALALQGASAAAQAESTTNVQILSAIVRDQKIDGARVTLQRNGGQSFVATTDPQGHAALPDSVAADPAALGCRLRTPPGTLARRFRPV